MALIRYVNLDAVWDDAIQSIFWIPNIWFTRADLTFNKHRSTAPLFASGVTKLYWGSEAGDHESREANPEPQPDVGVSLTWLKERLNLYGKCHEYTAMIHTLIMMIVTMIMTYYNDIFVDVWHVSRHCYWIRQKVEGDVRGDCGCDNTQVRESFAHFLLTLFPCAGTCSCDCDKQQDALAWKKTDSIQCETSMASIEWMTWLQHIPDCGTARFFCVGLFAFSAKGNARMPDLRCTMMNRTPNKTASPEEITRPFIGGHFPG